MSPRRSRVLRYHEAGRPGVEELVEQSRWVVPYVVERLRVALPDTVERDELIGAGSLGLVQAAHGFDPSRGVEFSTFAFERVRGAILDSLRKSDPLSRDGRKRYRELTSFEDRYRVEHGQEASDEDVEREVGLDARDADQLRQRAQASRMVSIDAPTREGRDPLRSLLVGEGETPLDAIASRERLHALARALQELPERERQVVTLYYYGGHLLKEIAAAMNVSAARVSQLHARALDRLRGALRALQAGPIATTPDSQRGAA